MHRRFTLALVVILTVGLATAAPASPSGRVHVLTGWNPGITAVFPSDRFTVADPRQVTGRRVHLPVPRCRARTSFGS